MPTPTPTPNNKERLLKVREIFHTETDEEHELSYQEVIEKLQLIFGDIILNNEKAIKDDIKTLIKVKPHLTVNTDKFGKKYFSFQERTFEIYELRLLMDAVSSARFITIEQRDDIIKKLKTLASIHQAERLVSQIFVDDMVVSTDEMLKITADKLHMAIQENDGRFPDITSICDIPDLTIINFKYGRYNLDKKFVIGGDLYKAVPIGLVMNNGFYYLVAFNIDKDKFINYRVDRMRKVYKSNEKVIKEVVEKLVKFDLKDHLKSCYNMYPGKKTKIEVQFDNHLINAIIDRFGNDVNIERVDPNTFVLRTEAAINTGLVRWILNWGADAEVLKPDSLKEMIRDETKRMFDIYYK